MVTLAEFNETDWAFARIIVKEWLEGSAPLCDKFILSYHGIDCIQFAFILVIVKGDECCLVWVADDVVADDQSEAFAVLFEVRPQFLPAESLEKTEKYEAENEVVDDDHALNHHEDDPELEGKDLVKIAVVFKNIYVVFACLFADDPLFFIHVECHIPELDYP